MVSRALNRIFARRPQAALAGLLGPAAGWLLIFFLTPLLVVLLFSFGQRTTYGGIELGLSLSNYARALDPLYLKIYWRSLWLAVVTTALCLLISYPAAYCIALKTAPRWKNLLLVLSVIPFWTSFLIRTYAWMLILRTEGLINSALTSIGLIDQPLKLLYTDTAILLGLVYGELPFMILPLYATIEKLDVRLLEAAMDLGANRFWTFLKVTLPLTKVGVVTAVLLVFIPSLGAFVTPDLLGGAKQAMIGNLIQNQFAVARDQPFGSAISFLLTFVVLALLGAGFKAGMKPRAD
ncbi:MAG TPA: ABC transporter permease [Acidobacteriota bacterium]